MKTEKTDVALRIVAYCQKVKEHLEYIEEIALERERAQRQFNASLRELDEENKEQEQELSEALKKLREDNNATLKYHGASSEVRALVDKMRYAPKHKSLPLEERLDAIERSIAKLSEEVFNIGKCVSMSMVQRDSKYITNVTY